jgi:hypothetical protein
VKTARGAAGAAVLSVLLLLPAACGKKEAPKPAPPPPAPPAAPPPEPAKVEVATETAKRVPMAEDYYKAGKLRDPFLSSKGGGGGGALRSAPVEVVVSTEAFDIHALELRGLLETEKGPMALLVDPNTTASYILKAGAVLDAKGDPVPGVTGQVQGQSVRLVTREKDVQVLSLPSEDEGNMKEDKGP